MALIKGEVSDDVGKSFRMKAMSRYGYGKGAISKALEEAVRTWLGSNERLNSEEEINNAAYDSMIDELEAKYRGKYIAIASGKLVAVADDLAQLLEEADSVARNVSHRVVLKLGEETPAVVRLGWRVRRKPAGPT